MYPRNCQNRGNALPSRNHQNGTFGVGRAAAEPTTAIAHGHARERNAGQNAPRAIGRSNGRSVVRFAWHFSRARVRTASSAARPHVHGGRAWRGKAPPPKKPDFQYFWLHSCPLGVDLACADGAINMLQYPENKNFLTLFCARCSRRHCRSGEKYFTSKSRPYGDGSHGASVCTPEIAKIGEMPFRPGTTKMALFGSVARPRSPRQE